MRQILSWSCGIASAVTLMLLLHLTLALGMMELLFCGILVCALVVNWIHDLTPLRRAAVRLRILLRREGPLVMNRLTRLQERVTAMRSKAMNRETRESELRRQLEIRSAAIGTGLIQAARVACVRVVGGLSWLANLGRDERLKGLFEAEAPTTVRERLNPMWLSYVVLSGWAIYEVVAVSHLGRDPMQRVAATASSAVDAVASTSAAVVALGSASLKGDPSAAMSAALLAGSRPDYLRDAQAAHSAPPARTNCTGRGAAVGLERYVSCPGILERLIPDTSNRGM